MTMSTKATASSNAGRAWRLRDITGNLTRTIAVLGLSFAALFTVGAVLALGTDSITLSGAAESNDWVNPNGPVTPPGPGDVLDLRVKTGPCDPTDDLTTYSDDPTFTMANHTVDLAAIADNGGTGYDYAVVQTLCLHNASAFNGILNPSLINSASYEVGDCDVDEAALDTTCADGDPGELADVLFLDLSYCDQPAFYEDDWDFDGVIDAAWSNGGWSTSLAGGAGWGYQNLNAGDTCQVEVGISTDHFSETQNSYGSGPEDQLITALSDSVSFDLVIDLEEF